MSTASPAASPRDQTPAKVLDLVRRGQAVTRADLVAATGYSRSTIGHAVGRLLETGLLEETDAVEKGPGSGRGRPGVMLRPVPPAGYVGAIDIGHAHVTAAIADSLGRPIAQERIAVGLAAEEKLDRAAAVMQELRRSHGIGHLALVVAGIPKPVNRLTGLVQAPRVGDGWSGLSPSDELSRRLGTPVHAENDALLGAIGEHQGGAARGHQDFLYVKASHGIGASIFMNDAPYRGGDGIVGSIGHSRLDSHTELCRCGRRGCLEAVCSVGSVRTQLAAIDPSTDSGDALASLNETTERVVNGAGRALGRVLADFCNLLGPSRIVLGGILGVRHPAFVEGVRWAVQEYATPARAEATEVVAAALGEESEIHGALALAAELHADSNVLAQPA